MGVLGACASVAGAPRTPASASGRLASVGSHGLCGARTSLPSAEDAWRAGPHHPRPGRPAAVREQGKPHHARVGGRPQATSSAASSWASPPGGCRRHEALALVPWAQGPRLPGCHEGWMKQLSMWTRPGLGAEGCWARPALPSAWVLPRPLGPCLRTGGSEVPCAGAGPQGCPASLSSLVTHTAPVGGWILWLSVPGASHKSPRARLEAPGGSQSAGGQWPGRAGGFQAFLWTQLHARPLV